MLLSYFSFIASLQQIEFSSSTFHTDSMIIISCLFLFVSIFTLDTQMFMTSYIMIVRLEQICDKNSFLLLLRRKGIRLILKFERVKLLPEKTQ